MNRRPAPAKGQRPAPKPEPLGLYVHVPFCVRRCAYCDFVSSAGSTEEERGRYVDAVCAEVAARGDGAAADTLYLGGGTPTLLEPAQVERIVGAVRRGFRMADGAEVSMEANPDTVNPGRLKGWRSAGVNRLSMGVQALDDRLLRALGRIHSATRAREAVHEAAEAGFANLGIDLMFGLPGQATAEWRETLRAALDMPVVHLSCYELALEEGTLLKAAHPALPGEDEAVEMWSVTLEETARRGFIRYEVSNYAHPGAECRHNLKYWRDSEFLGFGAGAWSSRDGARTANPSDVAAYLAGAPAGFPPAECDVLPARRRAAESMMLNLRLTEGCGEAEFAARWGEEALGAAARALAPGIRDGLVERSGGRLRLTDRGFLVANEVWREVLGG